MRLLRDLFFPPRCAACGALLPLQPDGTQAPVSLCAECLSKWEREEGEPCGFCGKPVSRCRCMPELLQQAGCQLLCKTTYYTPHDRRPVQNRVIYHIKEKTDDRTPAFLASRLLSELEAYLAEEKIPPEAVIVTYLPRTHRALARYGTDQARALACSLAGIGGFSFARLLLRRRGVAKEQKKLSATARVENAKASFRPIKGAHLSGKTVILVDDLITTGAGFSVCTRLLRRMGAARVICAAVASDAIHRDPG